MKPGWLKLTVVCIVMFFSLTSLAGVEVPWPVSAQQPLSVKHSQGLWYVITQKGTLYYNLEILDSYDGMHWVRVTELDTGTFTIRTFGEGYYYSDEPNDKGEYEDPGQYLYMFPNNDVGKLPYLLRVVALRGDFGMALGLSIYPREKGEEVEHAVGYRTAKEPLRCDYSDKDEDLMCKRPEVELK